MQQSMEERWKEFSEVVIPPDATLGERQCMQDAFFAGVCSLYKQLDSFRKDIDQGVPFGELQVRVGAYTTALVCEMTKYAHAAIKRAEEAGGSDEPAN